MIPRVISDSPRRRRRTLAALLLLTGCAAPRPSPPPWAEQALRSLDLQGQAAQLVMASLPAADDTSNTEDRLFRAITEGSAGGVLVRQGHAAGVAHRLRALHAGAPLPLLVALDLDQGLGRALEGATPFPPVRQVAVLTPTEMARAIGEQTAREARAIGASLGFLRLPATNGAEPLHPLARDPERVVRGFDAYLEGLREGGLLAGVRVLWNEEADVAELGWDRARLASLELTELAAALGEGTVAAELGALRLPAVTGDSVPLPFSPAALGGLLRRNLGWNGLISVHLTAESPLAQRYGAPEAAVRAVAAGADLLVGVDEPAAVVAALLQGVRSGRIPASRLADAAGRVLELKSRLREIPADSTPADSLLRRLRGPEAQALSTEAAWMAALPDSAAPPARLLEQMQWPPAPTLREAAPSEAGMDAGRLAEVDRILATALSDSVFSSAALAVGRRGVLVRLRGYGDPAADPERTLFDLASLTKVIGTTSAAALLVEDGRMSLDAPVQRYLPEFRGSERSAVRVWNLLTHTSGLPSGVWLYGNSGSPREAVQRVLGQPLQREPGERVLYSDLGMILLAEAVERTAEMPIDRFLAQRLFAPLGMSSTMYLPPFALRERIVPTAIRSERDFVLRGVVHDGNAFRLGGVAGHAGLFSTARDLAVFAQAMLNGGAYGTVRLLSPSTVALFTSRQSGAEQRAVGWDTPSDRSSAGRYFSARSFGHTGYTGTSLWIDPEKELFVVLLTNRTYTEASAGDVFDLRAAVHDAVAQAITDQPVRRRPGSR